MYETSDLEKNFRYFLLTLSAICLIGVMMVYSASYIYAKEIYGSSSYYFKKQIAFLLTGLVIAFVMYKTKINFWIKYGIYFQILGIAVLIFTLIPGIGIEIKGASRWIQLGGVSLQPGEMIKYGFLLLAIPYFDNFFKYTREQKINYSLLFLVPLGILLMQPDFGTFFICLCALAIACFFSNFPRKYFYSSLVGAVLIVIPILISQPYRVRRLFAYLDPWKNPQTSGFQIIQSYLAFANGSLFGEGLGNSNEKLFYLPEAHNDFIFSVIGEELGFMGVTVLIALFLLLIYFGLKVALELKSRPSHLLVSGIISILGLQVFLNMAVVLGLLPTKGLNLPFISAGGSSLLANFFAIGLIASAVRAQREMENSINSPSHYQYGEQDMFGQKATNQDSSFSL